MRLQWRYSVIPLAIWIGLLGIVGPVFAASQAPVEAGAAAGPANLSTPRATLTTFCNAMESIRAGGPTQDLSAQWEKALSCLYLQDIPAKERIRKGMELAENLYDLVENFVFDPETVPEKIKGKDCTIVLGTGDAAISLVLHRYSDNTWRFRYDKTLSRLSVLTKTVQEDTSSEKTEKASEFDPRFSSPRATMRTFFHSIHTWREGGLEDIADAFDLSEIGNENIRKEQGKMLAVQLMYILNRVTYIRTISLPNNSDLHSYTLLETPLGDIVLAPLKDEKTGKIAWKFTRETTDLITA